MENPTTSHLAPQTITVTDGYGSLFEMYENTLISPEAPVRLLRLDAGHWADDLHGQLVPRHHTDSYEALSLFWGDQGGTSTIRLSQKGKNYDVRIGPSLEAGLRRLRYADKPRYLWIDAICINQASPQEKSLLLPLIYRIYHGAAQVVIWLGEADEDSEIALDFITQILHLENIDRLVEDPQKCREWDALSLLMRRHWFYRRWIIQEIAFAKQATVFCGERSVRWQDLADAIAIFQGQSPRLMRLFSTFRSSPADFVREIAAQSATQLVEAVAIVLRRSEDGERFEPMFSLERLVSQFSSFATGSPHDTIYSFLPLAKEPDNRRGASSLKGGISLPDQAMVDADSSDIERITPHLLPSDVSLVGSSEMRLRRRDSPTLKRVVRRVMALRRAGFSFREPLEPRLPIDYSESFFAVCKHFLQFTFRCSESLDMICRPWIPPEHASRLPSWTSNPSGPAFGLTVGLPHATLSYGGTYSRIRADPLVGLPSPGTRNYNAAGGKPAQCRLGNEAWESKSLFVTGFTLDQIDLKEDTAHEGNVPSEWLELGGWTDTSRPPPDRFWRTLVADRSQSQRSLPLWYKRACEFAFRHRPAGGDLNTYKLVEQRPSSMIVEFLERVRSVIWKRRLIMTRNHQFLGLAPSEAKRQDLICILHGCSVPVVLRPQDDHVGRACYQFIGECYVHGMMDGEALELEGQERQEFELV